MGQGWAVKNQYARREIEKKEHERDKEIEKKSDKEDRPKFIEFYQYENRKYKIVKDDGLYFARCGNLVIGDESLDTLKNIKIPEYKNVKLY
ncbi:hypothetical protein G6Z12_07075 [Clostridium perfringens]|uniref:hypothetical protein n=1 Tax=Clostridium perfringens TaxID=1502 RepID=UPI0013E38BD5|nr:hypothetical protein [Clostridium perfringens]MDM0892999.1 hypothetical protein [Clostridium perfringens]NGT51704.1 hypothetical protein [Clostridium perfringens]NGU22002.1 hypothetical protein [Clostridium perfringens]